MNSQPVLEPLEALGPLPRSQARPMQAASAPLRLRVLEAVVSYLPILLMGLLALGTWWLVQNTQLPRETPAAGPSRHEPDYAMQQFSVQHFTPEGRLRAQIDGAVLRHYPDDDTLEIDDPHITAYAPDGGITFASAGRALANGDASEVQLLGSARVTREAAGTGMPLQFDGEFLHAFFKTEQVRSHLPATIIRGDTRLRADALSYDNLERAILLKGNVRASFAPIGSRQGGAH